MNNYWFSQQEYDSIKKSKTMTPQQFDTYVKNKWGDYALLKKSAESQWYKIQESWWNQQKWLLDYFWDNIKEGVGGALDILWWAVKWWYEWVKRWLTEWADKYWEAMVSDADKVNQGTISPVESAVRWAGRTLWYIGSDLVWWAIGWALEWWFKEATTQDQRDYMSWKIQDAYEFAKPVIDPVADTSKKVFSYFDPETQETIKTVWQGTLWALDLWAPLLPKTRIAGEITEQWWRILWKWVQWVKRAVAPLAEIASSGIDDVVQAVKNASISAEDILPWVISSLWKDIPWAVLSLWKTAWWLL